MGLTLNLRDAAFLGGGGTPSPLDFPNITLWYRGDYQTLSGGLPQVDTGLIDFWGEKVAGVANMLSGGGDEPMLRTNQLNGQNVVRFQGNGGDIRAMNVNDALLPEFVGAGHENYTVFLVVKWTDVTNLQMIVTKNLVNTTTEAPEFRIWNGKMQICENFPHTVESTSTVIADTWYVLAGVRDEALAVCRHYRNGVLDGTGARGTSSSAAGQPLFIGRRVDGFTVFDAMVAECIIYKHAFTDTQAASLQRYFTARYGSF